MATGTQNHNIFFSVMSAVTPKFFVMDLELLHASAVLTSPIIALEHLSAEFLILERVELDPRVFRADRAFTHFDLARRERFASARPARI